MKLNKPFCTPAMQTRRCTANAIPKQKVTALVRRVTCLVEGDRGKEAVIGGYQWFSREAAMVLQLQVM